MEQYLTYPVNAPLQDRMAEAILQTLIEVGPQTLANPTDYNARANMMWCATMALNGLIGAGVPQDWSTHMVGHELTALHGLDHGQTLAIVLPSMMQLRQSAKREKLLQYAERVWGIVAGDEEQRMSQAIAKTRAFFESVGVSTRLSTYGIGSDDISAIGQHLEARGAIALGEHQDVGFEEVQQVLVMSL
jgi:NADP-dependent alcohol dehydrogenase